jgi:hypothetical protein
LIPHRGQSACGRRARPRRDRRASGCDAGYTGVKKRPEIVALGRGIEWRVAARRSTLQAQPEGLARAIGGAWEKLKARARALVEHPFHIVKNIFGHRKSALPGAGEKHRATAGALRAAQPLHGAAAVDARRRGLRAGGPRPKDARAGSAAGGGVRAKAIRRHGSAHGNPRTGSIVQRLPSCATCAHDNRQHLWNASPQCRIDPWICGVVVSSNEDKRERSSAHCDRATRTGCGRRAKAHNSASQVSMRLCRLVLFQKNTVTDHRFRPICRYPCNSRFARLLPFTGLPAQRELTPEFTRATTRANFRAFRCINRHFRGSSRLFVMKTESARKPLSASR